MDDLNYEIIGALVLLAVLFFGLAEWMRYVRFRKYLALDSDVRLHQAPNREQHVVTGSIGMAMSRADKNVKGLLVLSLSFRNSAFSIPSVDQLYFKADSAQYLSVGFRIRRHDLRPLRGQQVSIRLKGRLYLKNGSTKLIKAVISVSIPKAEDAIGAEG
ncbi:hypothetical protein [Sphingobacterium bambusae]|uniref:Uncharacterized protein n=1 Tax=Sphingobacterium bambusae TaxID=662858 RepID=A0ABW6BBN8_9SPHI|nr:hypothetical protein [Sphingobacterium bambusae]WPL46847.1 hypothetical protein SCB77_12840 [Sphingobacterium bambusae]